MSRRFLVPLALSALALILAGAADPLPILRVERKLVSTGGRLTREPARRVLHSTGQAATGRSDNGTLVVRRGFWGRKKIDPATNVDNPTPDRPLSYRLDQNHPNPFNPRTTIRFATPRDGHVRLTIYDIRGRLVATLLDGVLPAGEHQQLFDAEGLASGVYFYRLTSPGFEQARRLVLAR